MPSDLFGPKGYRSAKTDTNGADSPDSALLSLTRIILEFSDFVKARGLVSEADTRVKMIDRILTEVCAWPESGISREEHTDRGFIDYVLTLRDTPDVVVEAKREGIPFTSPVTTSKKLKLSGTLLTDKNIAEAITQVRGYCDDEGIRYAVATNGYAWIVFRAIREGTPWREGNARIFPSLEYIESHFVEFWNLLSYPAIERGSLEEEFGASSRIPRQLHRVIDHLFNADLPLQRNRLHSQLHPLIQSIFLDIADQDPLEILESCYVHIGSLRIVTTDLNTVITDAIPKFLMDQGAEPIQQGPDDAGRFGDAVETALANHGGQLYLLLGGIGSGKTTFIKRYERYVGKPVLDERALWFHLDFLEAPLDPSTLEHFAWKEVLGQLRSRYRELNFETRRNMKRAFRDKIDILGQTIRAHMLVAGSFDALLSPHLDNWVSDLPDYGPRILRIAQAESRRGAVLFIDNVDQLSPAFQAQIFLLAQRLTRTVGFTTILALREESYYTANLQQTLTAYTSRKFHIASPRFRKLITSRINFALRILEKSQGPIDYVLRSGIQIDRFAIADFLRIIEVSIFEQNRNITRFIEAICFGNMRLALEMFTLFMTSGATDVDKMLKIYRRDGAYFVAFHEFVKSIMLGERRYYKDESSFIMNVFDCGAERNSSHFTSLRIIRSLSLRRGESTTEGQGYVEIGSLVSSMESTFDNREDCLRCLNRLVTRQLIEANTKSTQSIRGASHVRVTSAGWYYSRFLVKAFAYIDLVLEDTPLNDLTTERLLRSMVDEVDNLSDREDQRLERMGVRFARVRNFLGYLQREEQREQAEFSLRLRGGIWRKPFVPAIRQQIEREIRWVDRRLRENRERIVEDILVKFDFPEDKARADDDDSESPAELA